jgi:serine/threonine-protein kinase RsbW/stage II sporulation protein AB (anti-sigma F factor)
LVGVPATYQRWSSPAQPESVGQLRHAVAAFASAGGVSGVQLGDIRLCLSEAITNSVVHAFCDGRAAGVVVVSAEFGTDGLLVTVSDDGMGYVPRVDSPGLGLGIPTIGALSTSMTLGSSLSGGTELAMTFAA